MAKRKILKEGIVNGVQSGVIPALDIFVSAHPEWVPTWLLIRGIFSSAIQFRQDRINELLQLICDNPELFAAEIVQTEEFQGGFIITFESYIKQRSEEKRKIIQRIFVGFTSTADKERFELERMYHVLGIISLEGIKFLEYIKTHILPLLHENAEKQSNHHMNNLGLQKGKTKKYWYTHYLYQTDIEEFIYEDKKWREEDAEFERNRKLNESISELVSLSILKSHTSETPWVSLTEFGMQVISFIQK